MKFNHTPGPWAVKHSESKDAYNVIGTAVGLKYKIILFTLSMLIFFVKLSKSVGLIIGFARKVLLLNI